MSLINCPECKKEISDTVSICIHCGYSIPKPEYLQNEHEPSKETKNNKLEPYVHKAIDAIFALVYISLFYSIFFTDNFSDMDSDANWIGVFIAFVIIYFVQKIAKAIFGTIGRSFDDTFNKKNT